MDIMILDGEIVGYFGEMFQALAEKIGRENIHIAVENFKEIYPETEESREVLKYAEGYRRFKPEKIFIGKVTQLL